MLVLKYNYGLSCFTNGAGHCGQVPVGEGEIVILSRKDLCL